MLLDVPLHDCAAFVRTYDGKNTQFSFEEFRKEFQPIWQYTAAMVVENDLRRKLFV